MIAEPLVEFETPERVALSLPLAGVGARALASLLDLLLVLLCWVTALLLYSVEGDLLREVQGLGWVGQVLLAGGVLAAGWGWDVAWELGWRGQTPGKRALGLRVVGDDGAPVSPLASLLRNALRVVELPLGYAPAVLLVALSPRRQRLGDLVAGTLVLQERRYDLARYGPPAAAAARWSGLRERASALLDATEFDRLVDFLRRRGELEPAARADLAGRLARCFARRARLAAPGEGEAEGFLEALVTAAGEGR